MGNVSAGLELHVGKEATNAWGTAVAPTAKLMGVNGFSITPLIDVRQLTDELQGTMQPAYREIIGNISAEATLEGILSFEDAPYLFDMMFHHTSTDAYMTTDASCDAVRSYDAPIESSDIEDPRVMTFVYGDGTYVWGFNGGTARTLTLSAAPGEPVTYSLDMFGKNVTSDTLAALSDRSVDFVMSHHGTITIDLDSNAIGTSTDVIDAFSAELTINSNRVPKYHIGDQTPNGWQDHPWDGTLALTIEMSSNADDYIDAIVGATTIGVKRNVRMKFLSDSDYVQIDFGGIVLDQPEIFEDADGVISMTLNLQSHKTEGLTSWLECEIVNHVPALT